MAACMIAAVVSVGAIAAGKGYEMYEAAVEETSLEQMVASIREKDGYTELDQLPETYLNAVVSVEDHRFYRHFGLDMIAICRALVNDIKAGAYVEGGSTITQQLAKNLYFSQEKKLERKVAEVFAALALEEQYTKDEILELYVNSIYFGDGYYTVGDASRGYFGKEPFQMTEYESTLLAGIPNAPGKYAPTKNPQLAAKRQKQVLKRLEACGYQVEEETKLLAAVHAGDSALRMADISAAEAPVFQEQRRHLREKTEIAFAEEGNGLCVMKKPGVNAPVKLAAAMVQTGLSEEVKKGKGKIWLRRGAKPGDREKGADAGYEAASVSFFISQERACSRNAPPFLLNQKALRR